MENNQDKIDSYIRGEYNPSKREEFESSLREDKILKTDLELTKLIAKSLGDRVHVCAKTSQWENELVANTPSGDIVSKCRKLMIIGGSIAASLVICVFAFHMFYDSELQQVDDKYTFYMPHFSSSDYMSKDYLIYTEKIDSLLNILEYEEALKLIALVESDFEKLHSDNLNDGLEKAGIENEKYAINNVKYLNDEYILKWRKINVLFALGKKKEALSILDIFKEEDGKYKDHAIQLYNEMNKREY